MRTPVGSSAHRLLHRPTIQWSLRTTDTLEAGLLPVAERCPHPRGLLSMVKGGSTLVQSHISIIKLPSSVWTELSVLALSRSRYTKLRPSLPCCGHEARQSQVLLPIKWKGKNELVAFRLHWQRTALQRYIK